MWIHPQTVYSHPCSPERLLFLIKYGIAYVKMEKEVDGKIESTDQKHIMRYQQMFASLAIREQLKDGATSGVVWHTQGSGKTALSYYLTYVLSDYYAKHNMVAKFYFIVDRIDLLEQATQEFEARGLVVSTANTVPNWWRNSATTMRKREQAVNQRLRLWISNALPKTRKSQSPCICHQLAAHIHYGRSPQRL